MKTYTEVLAVIALGKPDAVVDQFITEYLATPPTPEPTDDEVGIEIEAVFDPLPVTAEQIAAFRLEHYAQLRQPHYPPMEMYLDAVVKADAEQIAGYVAECLAVKERFLKGR